MKLKRHTKILELIHEYEIETQEELALRLEEAGFKVTQATVSRDIRELCLTKVANKKGRSIYAVLQGQNPNLSEKYSRVLRDAFVSMDTAQNILVIKTVPGMAMGVAAALDELKFGEIIGSIAGDDTVMSVIKTADQSLLVMEKLRKILEELN
ncbi:MAG: arginine repressor [Eubacteriales bacterium]|nr:arginine repressor [Eubacteriales bacterium]